MSSNINERYTVTQKIIGLSLIMVTFLTTIQILLQNYSMQEEIYPEVERQLQATSERINRDLGRVYTDTLQDLRIMLSHESLSNYLDFESMDSLEEAGDQLVSLELFLGAIINTAPNYEKISLISASGDIITIVNGSLEETKTNLNFTTLISQHFSQATIEVANSDENALPKVPAYFSIQKNQDKIQIKFYVAHIVNEELLAIITGIKTIDKEVSDILENAFSESIYVDVNTNEGENLFNTSSLNYSALEHSPDKYKSEWISTNQENKNLHLVLTVHKLKEDAFKLKDSLVLTSLISSSVLALFIMLALRYLSSIMISTPLKGVVTLIDDVISKQSFTLDSKNDIKDEILYFSSQFDLLMHAIESMTSTINRSSKEIKNQTGELVTIVDSSKSSLISQLSNSDDSLLIVSQLVSVMESVKEEIRLNFEVFNRANVEILQGRDGIANIGNDFQTIASEVNQTQIAFSNVDAEMSNVIGVIEVITGIAEQINLLALNAAIESARAGEHGRGFAVVSDEIRNLARSTQDSTTKIKDIIKNLHVGIEVASEKLSSMVKKTQSGEISINSTTAIFVNIEEHFNEVRLRNNTIKDSADISSEKAASMQRGLIEIVEGIHQNNNDIKKLNEAGSELQDISEELFKMVEGYK